MEASIKDFAYVLLLVTGVCGCNANDSMRAPASAPPRALVETKEPAPSRSPEPVPPAEVENVAAPKPTPVAEVLALQGDRSTSVGSPIEGALHGGVALPDEGPGFVHNPRKRKEARYGTVELVQALVRAAAYVHETLPGSPLVINDLSLAEGGDISGHATHRSGRDVDILYYLLDAEGKPRMPKGIPLDPQGKGTDYGDLEDPSDDEPVQLDVPRTWAFFQALVTDPQTHIQKILIAEHLRTILLDHGRNIGAPEIAIERFGHVTCQPNFPHDDHAHLLVFCSAQDIAAGCEDTRPIYPWHQAELAAQGTQAVIAGPREGPRPKLTSHAEARKKAGAMHQDVIDFLERRKAWIKKPHPGRPYCK